MMPDFAVKVKGGQFAGRPEDVYGNKMIDFYRKMV
jgi:hypothetical protein